MFYRKLLHHGLISLLTGVLLAGCASNHNSSRSYETQDPFYSSSFGGSSIWDGMGRHMNLSNASTRAHMQHQLQWYRNHQAYVYKITTNAAPYIHYVYEQTRKRGLPAELALLPMIESAYNPFLFSRTGATGLWQMMPGTASGFGLEINWWYDGRRDTLRSTDAALTYLNHLHQMFGNWLLAIAAYNSGEGTVLAAIHRNQVLHKSTDFWSLPLPMETRSYVPLLLSLSEVIKNPSHYGLRLINVSNECPFAPVRMHQVLEIKQIAQLAHVKTSTIRKLNPGFRRWSTTPNQAYTLLLPKDNIEIFNQELAMVPTLAPTQRIPTLQWEHHRVTPGESLGSIARRYHTTVLALRNANSLRNDIIHPGQTILIQTRSSAPAHVVTAAEARYAADRVPGPQQVIHQVSRWDSLAKISRRYGTSVHAIQFWNNIGKGQEVRPNQKLVLWLKHRPRAAAPVYARAGGGSRYQVRAGDNLGSIARRYHVTVASLQQTNHIRGNAIRKNQWLAIPGRANTQLAHYSKPRYSKSARGSRTHPVKHGQTLYSIARQYHVSPQALIQSNHLNRNADLRAGQVLVIPRA